MTVGGSPALASSSSSARELRFTAFDSNVFLTCCMDSPVIDETALSSIQTRLFTELIRDSLQEYAYDAELAGLSFAFDQQADGILLSMDGYNDKLSVLVNVIATRMRDYQVDVQRFHLIHDQVREMRAASRIKLRLTSFF